MAPTELNLSEAELRTLAIIPHITGTISVVASCYVLQDILRDPEKRKRTYCRLVLGMAAIDFVTSLMYSMSTLPMDKEGTQYGVFAHGNEATCTMQAFLIQMEIASPIYHFYLAWYYLLILKYRWNERKFGLYENKLHAFALFFSLATSIGLIPFGVYGEFFVWCWITNVEGNGYYQWFFFFGPLWFIILASSVIMAQMCIHVRAEETVSRKWRNSIVDTRKLGEKKLKKMANRVFWQAMHYELAFYATWTIPTISQTIIQLASVQPAFGMQLANCIFTPLAGFFNFTIYIRPRYVKYMEENKKEMWWYILFKAVKTAVPSRKMKMEIVPVDEDEGDGTNRGSDDCSNLDDSGRKQTNGKSEEEKIQDFQKKFYGESAVKYGYEDPDAAAKKFGYEDPDTSAKYSYETPEDGFVSDDSISLDDLDEPSSLPLTKEDTSDRPPKSSRRMNRSKSQSIIVLKYEENDVAVMDPAAALEQLYDVDQKLKGMSLPKKGRRKVYKLVKKINKGVKKRRRSLTGSVRSMFGMDDLSESHRVDVR